MKVVDLATTCATLAVALALAIATPASAQGIPDGTKVRILPTGLAGGCLEGKVQMNKSSGCG